MSTGAHLWAIGYDNMERANQVREVIDQLGWGPGREGKYLFLVDALVVVRQLDGSFTIDHKRIPAVENILATTTVGFLTGLLLGMPLTGAAVGGVLGGLGSIAASADIGLGIGKDFIREVEGLMKPGSSALFVLDDEGDMEVILQEIQGLGGTVLKTNVDLERAKLIQSTLQAGSASATKLNE